MFFHNSEAAARAVDRELIYIGRARGGARARACARARARAGVGGREHAILRAGPGQERPGIEKSTAFN